MRWPTARPSGRVVSGCAGTSMKPLGKRLTLCPLEGLATTRVGGAA